MRLPPTLDAASRLITYLILLALAEYLLVKYPTSWLLDWNSSFAPVLALLCFLGGNTTLLYLGYRGWLDVVKRAG